MNNSTPPHLSQSLTPDEAKASLGIASRLQMQHVMPRVAPQAPQKPNSAPASPTASVAPQPTPEPAPQPPTNQTNQTDMANQMQGLESRIMVEIGALKEEIKQTGGQDTSKELQDLKTQIQSIIDSND